MNSTLKTLVGLSLIPLAFGFFLRTSVTEAPQNLAGGTGTIQQLEQWVKRGGYITQNVASTTIKLTGYESNGDCLVTNASGIVSTSTCGAGGSGELSDWQQVNGVLTPTSTIGISIHASSTIGDGTGAGGLTVLGNSTTTGNAYFAGSVGIGTTNPYNKLHVRESAVAGSASNADDLMVIERDGDSNLNFIGGNASTVGFLFSDTTRGVGQVKYNLNTNNMFFISSGGGYAFGEDYWSASPGTNNVVIQGKVGIGSTSPSKKLSITGDMALSSGFYDTASSSGSKGNVLMSTGTSTLWVATSTLFSSLGTVTSVDMSVPTGLSISGNPITTSGTLALALSAGYTIPTTTRLAEHDTAYSWGNHAVAGYDQVTTAGDGLTRTVNDFDCDTASGSVFGCLSSTDWNTFNGKESVLTVSGGLTRTANNIAPTTGYNIPLTASTTEWNSFYTTPSGRITAGTGIDWTGNTLNGVYTAGDALTLTGTDIDFDGGATPSGDLGGTWASPSVTDDSHAHTGATLSGIDISADTNLTADGTEIILTGDALSLGTALTFTTGTSTTSFFSGLGRFTNAVISTLLTAVNAVFTGLVDIGAGVLEIPNGTAPTVDSVGELALDTTSNQLVLYGSEKKVIGNGNLYPAFTYATSTAWTGTTTIPLGVAIVAETWNSASCFTDVGTVNVDFGDGTNWMNATTSKALNPVPTHTLSSNNTFTAGETRYARVGTPVSSPTKISCSVSKSLTSD
jgi:hypothetical protein